MQTIDVDWIRKKCSKIRLIWLHKNVECNFSDEMVQHKKCSFYENEKCWTRRKCWSFLPPSNAVRRIFIALSASEPEKETKKTRMNKIAGRFIAFNFSKRQFKIHILVQCQFSWPIWQPFFREPAVWLKNWRNWFFL